MGTVLLSSPTFDINISIEPVEVEGSKGGGGALCNQRKGRVSYV